MSNSASPSAGAYSIWLARRRWSAPNSTFGAADDATPEDRALGHQTLAIAKGEAIGEGFRALAQGLEVDLEIVVDLSGSQQTAVGVGLRQAYLVALVLEIAADPGVE